MKLNCYERIMALQLLSSYKEGNFATFKSLGELKSKLFLTEQETVDFELKLDNDMYSWGEKGKEPVEIEMTDMQREFIQKELTKLNDENKLIEAYFSLYVKFVEENQN